MLKRNSDTAMLMDMSYEFAKAMKAASGVVIDIYSNQMAKNMLSILLVLMNSEVSASNVIRKAFEFYDEDDHAVITHIVCNTVDGARHISLIIGTKKHPVPKDLSTDDGVFAYVYNVDVEYDSELGYIFLEKKDDGYHRIG